MAEFALHFSNEALGMSCHPRCVKRPNPTVNTQETSAAGCGKTAEFKASRGPLPLSVGCLAAILLLVPTVLPAQTTTAAGGPNRYRWTWYGSPATAISAQIHAEADLVRAYGEASLDLAHARDVRAQAVRKEIANSVESVKAYWERRSIYEAEKMKRYVAPLERKQIQDSKTWERLKDHPELSAGSVVQGNALNFLLARLSGNVLAYQFSLSNRSLDPNAMSQIRLTPATLHALQLRQGLSGGQRLVFRADEGVPTSVDWWPYLLRDDAFAAERKEYDKARRRVVTEASSGTVSNDAMNGLLRAFDDLNGKFAARYTRQARIKSAEVHHDYLTTERFLQSRSSEIARIKTVGSIAGSDSLRFNGDNVVALLTHMSRNGLDFAPAQPGDEPAYHTVFRMMRDIYITVADN
jgi:hypothetical protein